MDFFSLAHSRRHFGAYLHLQLFLEPFQWFRASGIMCNIFVDTCIRHSEVSADCRFPTSSSAPSKPAERRSLHCSESVPPVVLAYLSVVLELFSRPSQLLGCSLEAPRTAGPELVSVGSGTVASVELQTPGAFNVICFQKQGISSLFKALN